MATPTRQTSEADLNRWNTAMRASPPYQDYMRSIGNDGSGRVKLSRAQQSALEEALRRAGISIPDGMHIDQGGNLNQKNHLGRNLAIGAAIGGGALTGLGLAGMGPLSGLGGGAAATGAGAMSAPELGLDAIPSVLGGAVTESASAYPFLAGAAGAGATGAAAAGGAGAARAAASGGAAHGLGGNLINAAVSGLSGLPALFGNHGVSDQEQQYQQQAQRLLAQQEQRTQYQNPLYEAATRMAYSLLPNTGNGGNPYPYSGLSDVNLPGMDELSNAQRNAQRR